MHRVPPANQLGCLLGALDRSQSTTDWGALLQMIIKNVPAVQIDIDLEFRSFITK